jgi:hypothetical protein
MAMGAEVLSVVLENAVDQSTLQAVVEALAQVCRDKADHIASSWQDESLAKVWNKAGQRLEKVAADFGPGAW